MADFPSLNRIVKDTMSTATSSSFFLFEIELFVFIHEGNGFKCSNLPLEIGNRGFINLRNKSLLTHLCNIMKVKKVSQVTKMCSKLAVLGSFSIWNARYSADWSSGGYLAA